MSDSWIQTARGGRFDPFDPRPEDVDLAAIAQALGNLCRYNGHVREFYSVGQHSVLVSRALQKLALGDRTTSVEFTDATRELPLAGLLHDAAEGCGIGDIVAPVKRQALLRVRVNWNAEGGLSPGQSLVPVGDVEDRILRAIYVAIGLPYPARLVWDIVRAMDRRMLMAERRDLMPPPPAAWSEDEAAVEPWPDTILAWGPLASRTLFASRARELGLEVRL